MNLRTVRTIVKKELLESLRDKHTLVAMIGIPVVLYPLLILVMTQVMTVQRGKLERMDLRVAIAADVPPQVQQWVGGIEKIQLFKPADPRASLSQGEVDVVIEVGKPQAANPKPQIRDQGPGTGDRRPETRDHRPQAASLRLDLAYDSTEERSRRALDRVREGLHKVAQELVDQRLSELGLSRQG